MSIFRTCKNCVREGSPCERRDDLKAAVTGLGLTSIKHRCKERLPVFAVGQRVSVTWPVIVEEDGYGEAGLESWPATVIKESGGRFLISVDDAKSDCGTPAKEYVKNPTLFARTTAARLTPLDEPIQAVCDACQRVGDGPFGEGGCYGQVATPGIFGSSGWRPMHCRALAKPAPSIQPVSAPDECTSTRTAGQRVMSQNTEETQ